MGMMAHQLSHKNQSPVLMALEHTLPPSLQQDPRPTRRSVPLQPILPPSNRHGHPVLLLLRPTPMWMPNEHNNPMRERVEVSPPSRGLLACARGITLSITFFLARVWCVFHLYTSNV